MPASTRSSTRQGPSNGSPPSESASVTGKRKLEETSEPVIRFNKFPKLLDDFKLHETHRYRDGNLLLQVDGKRFMVHRSRLEAASPWFHMLCCRNDRNGCDVYGGSSEIQRRYIDACLATSETLNEISLFHLDCVGHGHDVPSAAEFTAFLDSIYNGIDYAFEPPSIDQLVLLAGAAVIYEANTFISYVDKYLKVVFPSDHLKLGALPSAHVAVQGIVLARRTSRFDILATAFYDLARVPASAIEECIPVEDSKAALPHCGSNEPAPGEQAKTIVVLKANQADLSPQLTENAKRATFNSLGRNDLLKLNLLQKRLAASWDEALQDILAIQVAGGCCAGLCALRSQNTLQVLQKFSTIKAAHLSDPILGMKALIKENFLKTICVPTHNKLTKALKDRRSDIWKKIRKEWVQ